MSTSLALHARSCLRAVQLKAATSRVTGSQARPALTAAVCVHRQFTNRSTARPTRSYFTSATRLHSAPRPVPTINVQEAQQHPDQYDLWLDVREPHEWEAGHIDDAMHVPLGYVLDIEKHPDTLKEIKQHQKVLCYCARGMRSEKAAQKLRELGIDATNLAGGFIGWQAQEKQ